MGVIFEMCYLLLIAMLCCIFSLQSTADSNVCYIFSFLSTSDADVFYIFSLLSIADSNVCYMNFQFAIYC